ncbi:hypothetical protein [Microcoleus sp. T3_D1]|uniref:hypothetical protein n=1 Tax=Microcoleus sp. T3_D1 TaxID=3055427 RepID=UPI002FCFE962
MTESEIAEIKKDVMRRVHKIADEADWRHLTINQRTLYYKNWTSNPEIGGRLSQIMELERVRVYLKDTVMKSYSRTQRLDIRTLIASMSLPCEYVTQKFIKPQGLLCNGTDLYTLTVAKEWKTALLSAFERGYELKNLNRNTVFIIEHTTSRFVDQSYRDMIATAAERLTIDIHWVT